MKSRKIKRLMKFFIIFIMFAGFFTPVIKNITFAVDDLDVNEGVVEEIPPIEEMEELEQVANGTEDEELERVEKDITRIASADMQRIQYVKQIGDCLDQTFYFDDGTERNFYSHYINGQHVYCIEPGVSYNADGIVEQVSIDFLPQDIYRKVIATMHYGFQGQGLGLDDDPDSKTKLVITQTVMWSLITGATTSQQIDTYCAPILSYVDSQGYRGYYNTLKSKVLASFNKPSFDNTSIELSWNISTKRYEATLTDTNFVLDNYTYQSNGITFEKSGNNLHIYTTKPYPTGTQATAKNIIKGGMLIWQETEEPYYQRVGQYVAGGDGYTVTSSFSIHTKAARIGTTAISKDTNDHISNTNSTVTIVDTIQYQDLNIGQEYTIRGILMNKTSNTPLLVNQSEVHAQKKFIADSVNGSVTLEFTFDARALEGTSVVVFERLYVNEIEVATHTDINDEKQTVYFPKIETTAIDKGDGDKEIHTDSSVTIIDTVLYTNLIPNKEYTIKGVLMDKSTGNPLLTHDGLEVRAERVFTPTSANGSVDLEFTFDASLLYDTTIVVFEDVYLGQVKVGSHTDINDEKQSIKTPKKPVLSTTATSQDTSDHISNINKEVTIVDVVAYKNLEVDKEYCIKGILMNKATGEPLTINGNKITNEKTFTPSTPDGNVELEFTFDASTLEGVSVVVFETLEKNEYEVGSHNDIDDEGQTVYFPKIRTSAKELDSSEKTVATKKKVTIVDRVIYHHLIPKKEYTINGVLMNKATEKPLLVDGKKITSSITFTPTSSSGYVDLEFTLNTTALHNTTIVVFEDVYLDKIKVGSHSDIEDQTQTIQITKNHKKRKPKNTVSSGDNSNIKNHAYLALGSSLIILYIFFSERKNKKVL